MPSPANDQIDEGTVEDIAAIYRAHDRAAGHAQRLANRVTGILSRPAALTIVAGLMIAWIVGNHIARRFGSSAFEEFPFPDLGFVATVGAVLIALLILTTQRHENDLAEKRARLMLHIAVLSEKKIAKIIELLEEQRRDNPLLASRIDSEAEAMASATDPLASLEQLDRIDEGD